MPYSPYGWQDGASGGTPLSSADLEAFGAHYANQVVEGVTTIATAGTSQTLTLPVSGKATWDITGSAATCALTVTGTAAGVSCAAVLILRQPASGGPCGWKFPTNWYWPNGQLPPFSQTASHVDIITAVSSDNGATFMAALGSQNGSPVLVPSAAVLTVTAGTNQNALSWTVPNPGGAPISSWVINRGTSSGGETSYATAVAGATSYTDTSVTDGTTYYYTVQAVNAGGNGTASNEQSGTPLSPTPPGQPTITVTAGAGQNTISFSAPSNGGSPILYYWLQRSTTTGSETNYQQLSAAATSYVDTEVTASTQYFYKLVAYNVNGGGTASAEQSGTPTAGTAATNWIDSGQNNYTITVQGSPTLPAKVAGASGYGNALSLVSNGTTPGMLLLPASLGYGGGGGSPYTVECFFLRSATQSVEQGLVAKWNPSGSQNMYLYITSTNKLGCASHDTTTHVIGPLNSTTTITDTTTWHHAAMSYDGSTFYLFLDGVLVASQGGHGAGTLQAADNTTNTVIGGQSVTTNPFIGDIDEVRCSSVARYTATFTPPSSPFTPDANTTYLVHMD